MLTNRHILIAALAFITSSCAPEPILNISTEMVKTTENAHQMESSLFQEVNSYRKARSKKAVSRDGNLDNLARAHAQDLLHASQRHNNPANNANHSGWMKRSHMAKQNSGLKSCGENVLWASYRMHPNRMVQRWQTSPAHNKNMLGNWDTAGIGVTTGSKGEVFAVQIFGDR